MIAASVFPVLFGGLGGLGGLAAEGPAEAPGAPDPGEATSDAAPEAASEAPERFAPNGQPCAEPGADVPRLLLTTQGFHPCEEARYVDAKRGLQFFPGLQMRMEQNNVSPFVIDSEGTEFRDGPVITGRVRWRPELQWTNGRLVAGVDFAAGRWTGGSTPLATELLAESRPPLAPEAYDGKFPPQPRHTRQIDPRELWIELTFPRVGLIRIGQQSFAWGQGLLSNDGNNMARFGDLKFGPDGPGNINERLLFATKPFSPLGGLGEDIVIGLGGDLVYRDDNASLMAGDIAAQGFLLAMWRPEDRPGTWLGGYAVHRWQKNADDGDIYPSDDVLQVTAVDLAGQGHKTLTPKLALIGAFEGVVIAGRTDIAETDADAFDEVRQGATALRGYIGNPGRWLAGMDAGFLSGDANTEDDLVNNFQANRGYAVGLVLFPQVLGWQSARARMLAADDDLGAVDPQGVQRIPTRGAATNAIHVQPKAQYQLREWLELWGGPLFAWSATDVVDPYATKVTGSNANARGGGQGKRFYGTELDLGLRARGNAEGVWFQGGLQSGLFFPGAAVADAAGDVESLIWAITARFEMRY